ncbi:MAG: SprT family zinc-dependent metalloprotease [Amphiplicatus sp.]
MTRRSAFVETEIDLGDRLAPLEARVNRRARRLIVRVDPVLGRVLAIAPSQRALPEAIAFARERVAWIRARLAEGAPARPFRPGGLCPYRGIAHRIVNAGPPRAPVTRCAEPRPQLVVGGDPAHVNRRLVDWLKREAKRALAERADHYAGRLGVRRGPVRIRDTRSRWGSCSSDGTLSFSWRLILAPPAILDYVAAHECAHLLHLDHSPAFWRALARLDVDAEAARDWFAREGPALFAWGAEAPARRFSSRGAKDP